MRFTKSVQAAISAQNATCSEVTAYGLRTVVPALQQHGELLMAAEFARKLRESQRAAERLSAEIVSAMQKPTTKSRGKRPAK